LLPIANLTRDLSRRKDADNLRTMEEDLRVRKLAGVVGELMRLTLTPARRRNAVPCRVVSAQAEGSRCR
jgi:hypothetical protein